MTKSSPRAILLVPVAVLATLAIDRLVLRGPETAPASTAELVSSSRDVLDVLRAEPIAPLPLRLDHDPEKAALGRRLFFETRLSRTNEVSCATCHPLEQAGQDGQPVSLGIEDRSGRRNSPTVFNSVFNFRQFWDGRAEDLHEQIDGPLLHEDEMGGDWDDIVAFLEEDASYAEEFYEHYGEITPEAVRDAIATFEVTLLTPDSPFDRYLRGQVDAISEDARRGYELFKDLGCISCHQGVNVGGNMFQRFGVVEGTEGAGGPGSDDLGRFEVTGRESDRFNFKVPTLRNIEHTAPYFHDGSVETLEEAIQVMARRQLGVGLPDEEVRLLIAFLNSLTGEFPK